MSETAQPSANPDRDGAYESYMGWMSRNNPFLWGHRPDIPIGILVLMIGVALLFKYAAPPPPEWPELVTLEMQPKVLEWRERLTLLSNFQQVVFFVLSAIAIGTLLLWNVVVQRVIRFPASDAVGDYPRFWVVYILALAVSTAPFFIAVLLFDCQAHFAGLEATLEKLRELDADTSPLYWPSGAGVGLVHLGVLSLVGATAATYFKICTRMQDRAAVLGLLLCIPLVLGIFVLSNLSWYSFLGQGFWLLILLPLASLFLVAGPRLIARDFMIAAVLYLWSYCAPFLVVLFFWGQLTIRSGVSPVLDLILTCVAVSAAFLLIAAPACEFILWLDGRRRWARQHD